MADIKLKNELGEEQTYAGIESVMLPRADGNGNVEFVLSPELQEEKSVTITENGTTEITGDEGFVGMKKVSVTTNVESKEAVADFGDAEGSGCVIFLPDDSGVEIYTKCAPVVYVDSSYAGWLCTMPTSPTVLAALDAFAARIVANPSSFNSIFSGVDYVMFMDSLHNSKTPSVANLSAPTWKAFSTMLCNTLDDYDEFSLPIDQYTKSSSETYGTLEPYKKASFPFVWYPALKGGQAQLGLIPNTPTGTMPRYQTIYKQYGSGIKTAIFVNSAAALGIAYDCVAMFLGFSHLIVYSHGAQTLAKEMLDQMFGGTWANDVTLAEGWNYVVLYGDGQAVTLEQIQLLCKSTHWFYSPIELDYEEMSDYEKSAFTAYWADTYTRAGTQSFTVTLNVVCEDTTTNS